MQNVPRCPLREAAFLVVLCAGSCTWGAAGTGSEAPVLPGAVSWTFDREPAGTLPQGFEVDATNPGASLSRWQVHADAQAPSAPAVVSLFDARGNQGSTYNLLWTRAPQFLDGSLEVKLRADQGSEDRGGGVAWRIRDRDHYYVARWNPLEHNLRAYRVKAGERVELASADTQADLAGWHTLRVTQEGNHIRGFLDGAALLDFHDDTFAEAGGAGLWTKADAATSFDDLTVSGVGVRP